jgi:nitroreductase
MHARKGERTMDEIYTRRSTRRYTGESVPTQTIRELIKAGMNAPSGQDRQPWQFVIVADLSIMKKMVEYNPHWAPLLAAGQGIVVCGDLTINADPFYNFVDCSAATQNILLQAESMGYGTCWLGVAPSLQRAEAVRGFLNMPEHFLPVTLIAVGVKDETKEPNNRFLEDRIHENSF